MAEKKQYLDQEGLARLVDYIQLALKNKADIGSIPDNVALKEDLAGLIKATEIEDIINNSDLAESLTDVIHEDDIADVVRNDDIANVVRNDDIVDVVRQDAFDNTISQIRESLGSVYHFKGSVANLAELEAIQEPAVGDVYNIEDTGMNAGWTGSVWDYFGSVTDLTDYLTKEEVNSISIPVVDSILYGGKSAVVDNKSSIDLMLSNEEPKVEITLGENLELSNPIIVPEGKEVILDLGGNKLQGANLLQVNGGKLTLKNGSIKATAGAGVRAINGAEVTVDGANIVSDKSHGIAATDSKVTVNNGTITAQEAGVLGLKNSNIFINGGTISGIDNCPVMGNGSPAGSANDGTNMNVIMNGGKLIAHIQTAGYIACGVYVPNSGSFTMNGGEVISDGAGLVMRGGQVNLNGGRIEANGQSGVLGGVGDSNVIVGPYAVVYDAQSNYPAMNTLELNIAQGMVLKGTDGDINYILQDGVEKNVNDNR